MQLPTSYERKLPRIVSISSYNIYQAELLFSYFLSRYREELPEGLYIASYSYNPNIVHVSNRKVYSLLKVCNSHLYQQTPSVHSSQAETSILCLPQLPPLPSSSYQLAFLTPGRSPARAFILKLYCSPAN